MVNTKKLKKIIYERGHTQQELADLIGIDRSTFYRKMKNGGDFSVKEARKLAEKVPLTNLEAVDIFFSQGVA
ncbi:hypothetical protein SDC9_178662 [bioreactor metagenome]|uniref:HTH cro/C1-type domain-containing protein n=1 Tax=bioreactor metagenome TaxID=1076179 RepID=A0A645GWT5_9ZZZZ|nr:helix-turn-helix transcriptional regulator [Enterococcus thailandicus]